MRALNLQACVDEADPPSDRAPLDTSFKVRFWGTRGSIPVCGEAFRRYGGNTPCIEMICGGRSLLFDAGTGIKPAGVALRESGARDLQLFFTHFHYDHVIGLPFFVPLYDPAIRLEIWSGHLAGKMSTQEMLRGLMREPWFPIEISMCRAALLSRDFHSGDVLRPMPGVTIRTGSLNHPGGCIGYRVEFEGRSVALISDTEHVEGVLDPTILQLIDRADLVIYDAAYTEEELPRKKGFGHSTWQQGVKLCKAAGARKLALFHHDPFRNDAGLAELEALAKAAFAGAFTARDGQTLAIATQRTAHRA